MHELLDTLLLGKSYPEVHDYMDMYQKDLQSNHRLLNHDMSAVEYVYFASGYDYGARLSAYYHILLDLVSDEVGHAAAIKVLLERLGYILTYTG